MRGRLGVALALLGAVLTVAGLVLRGIERGICDPRCSSVPGTAVAFCGMAICFAGVLLWRRA